MRVGKRAPWAGTMALFEPGHVANPGRHSGESRLRANRPDGALVAFDARIRAWRRDCCTGGGRPEGHGSDGEAQHPAGLSPEPGVQASMPSDGCVVHVRSLARWVDVTSTCIAVADEPARSVRSMARLISFAGDCRRAGL